jgi:pyruvate dehydrogenase E2 component (dihydrolipoamide acetyltransferase)
VAKTFLLPDIGEGLTDAEIVEWSVAVGDPVEEGTLLCEIETAKAVVELTAPWPGVVLHLGGEAGDTIAVGAALVVIGEPGETWSADTEPAALSSESAAAPSSPAGPEATEPAVKAMPVVRRLAAELGVDLAAVTASGPGGRITREDVQAAAAAGPVGGPADERVPLSRLRRTIASHMSQSWDEIPHVTTFDDVNVKPLVDLRASLAAEGRAVPLEALLVRAALPALAAHPEFNATLEDEELVLHRRYDIGVAVDTPGGLVVPVLRAADQLDLAGLGAAIEDLSTRARTRKLEPTELAGGTFTVSNIGALGGGHGTPIIPTGTTAIVSFGRATDTATVVEGVVAIAPIMPVSLSYDHRVIDGGLGRRFVDDLVAAMGDVDRLQSR